MISWSVFKRSDIDSDGPRMARVRADRRLDVMVAMDFLDTKREVDKEEEGFVWEPQRMYVKDNGFVEKDVYLERLEDTL